MTSSLKQKAKQLASKGINCLCYLVYNEQMHPLATLLCNAVFHLLLMHL